jgi:hypothetical protein
MALVGVICDDRSLFYRAVYIRKIMAQINRRLPGRLLY